jgi:hypothetical protein
VYTVATVGFSKAERKLGHGYGRGLVWGAIPLPVCSEVSNESFYKGTVRMATVNKSNVRAAGAALERALISSRFGI